MGGQESCQNHKQYLVRMGRNKKLSQQLGLPKRKSQTPIKGRAIGFHSVIAVTIGEESQCNNSEPK